MTKKQLTKFVFKRLKELHPDAQCELRYSNPLELLIATILSAQCTDTRVNIVTECLFKKCKTLEDYQKLSQRELERMIKSTGFFRNKAKSILGAVRIIAQVHRGRVPNTLEELVKLPGVGRKTANVILSNAFSLPGFPVDTHVKRLTNRIGLTDAQDPVKIEQEVCALLPAKDWGMFSHLLIFHGRRICGAKKPNCGKCPLRKVCRFANVHS